MRKILRCGVLLAAASVALLLPARAAETLRVGKSSPASSAIMPIDVGAQMGVFARHGFDIKIADFSGGSRLFQAMVAGSIDIGISAGPEMALIVKGAPVLAICNMAPPVPFLGIVLPADSPVRVVDDLRGKRIGVASELSLSKWLALELARTRGWGIDGVTTVAVGNAPAAVIAAFRTHSIDADIGSTSFAFNL
jgi:ABC-type nitrate/sulfonate/bicarbonate transport system substrate-binding protein